ncbi:hypothetical protein FKW77_005391 [Venturia effusa]|uniref:MYND-type zinc finger protein samB n=1 Tax=Venturia effusa TaxID=50376 RepID=A0A517LLI6_9PEZI|nr:hypothetical protein FKW77_005391 [Venturia effusa]
MEEAPAHACDYCGIMTINQCSASHPNFEEIGGCPLFSFYCCLEHQQIDSDSHQEKCGKEAIKIKLVEISRTIQECWLTIRQNTWDHEVKHIHIDESGTKGKVVCELGNGEKFAHGKVFHEFDESLVEQLQTKFGIVRDAVLTAGTSEHAVACLYKLVEHLLQDLTTHIEEVRILPSVPLLVVQNLTSPGASPNKAMTEFNRGSNHWVYKVTTKTGEDYAIDITGIQYGDDCVCSRWEDIAYSHRVFGESHIRLHNVLNTDFSTLETAYREINWMHLSFSLDDFVSKLKEVEVKVPLAREELVRNLDTYLKETLPVDASEDFREWVDRYCDTPTPLAKMLSRLAPGVVPRGVELHEEIRVGLEEVSLESAEPAPENMYERYLQSGKWSDEI